MIGYISLVRETGKRAWVRADEIAAFGENDAKVNGEMTPCLTVLLRNNVAWHFPNMTGEMLLAMVKGVTGTQVQELRDSPDGRVP